ncbi:putative lipoprotein [Neisseria meningitidis 992008]|nr:putative lipoprotein [Neisseria meningitidis 992008]
MVSAVVNQIANSLTDRGYQVSKTAAYNLLSPYSHNGILKGPRFVEEQPK